MAESPLILELDENIGPEKHPDELILFNVGEGLIEGLSKEERREQQERLPNKDMTGIDTNIGPEKHPDELALTTILDIGGDEELNLPQQAINEPKSRRQEDKASSNPGKFQILEERAAQEALFGLNSGDLSSLENFAGGIYLDGVPSPLDLSREGTTPPPPMKYDSVEDMNLSPDQMQRYQDLVDSGEIDEDDLFGGNLNKFNPIAMKFGIGGSGITARQALQIVMGNDREGISQYSPYTNQTYTQIDIGNYNRLSREFLMAQGFRPLLLNQTMGVGQAKFLFQLLPTDERRVRKDGSLAVGRRNDGLTNALTLEEQLLVAELLSGHARLYGDPRDPANKNNPDINETILFGDHVL